MQNLFAPPTVKIRVPKQHSTHFPIPFFISNLKYGFEIDTNYTSSFDFASKKKNEFTIQVQSTELAWTLYGGKSPKETLSMYTERRGRSLIPPIWGFGPWNQLGGEFNHTRNELEAAREFLKMDIPISHSINTVHFLPTNDEDGREEELKEMNQKLLDMGLKSTSYYNAYVAQTSRDYSICDKNNYFVKHHNSSESYTFVYLGSRFFTCAMFDYTNPEAVAYYHQLLKRSDELKFNGAMYDYAEYLPYYSKSFDGRYGDELHNIHPVLYQKAQYDYLVKNKTITKYAPDHIFYVRSGYTGTQRWQWSTWTGDPSSDWSYAAGLPAQIPASVNLGLSGVPYSGSDIGGFTWWVQLPPSPELWCRWAQLGAFSGTTHTQNGGMGIGRKTKILDTKEGRHCWRKVAKIRTQLFPYIYTAAHQAYDTGLPLMRHHLLEFPDDQFAHQIGYDYMFGDSILVSPVINRGQVRKQVYLPTGFEWYDLMNNLIYDVKDGRFRIKHSNILRGGTNVTVDAPIWDNIPLFVKAGTIIPTIDPSIFTLGDAKEENVISMNKRNHLLHLWVFPNSQNIARFTLWDNSTFLFDNNKLFIRDSKNRIMIIQIILKSTILGVRGNGSGEYKRVESYQDLISTDRTAPQSLFTYSNEEGVLWIRTNPRDQELLFKTQ